MTRTPVVTLCAAFAAHIAFMGPQILYAAVPVDDANNRTYSAAAPVVVADGDQTNQLRELFYQIQILRQEVQDLRGMVEEQGYQVKRLTRDQKDQYMDLDRRLTELRAGEGVAMTDPSPSQSSERPQVGIATDSASSNERTAYSDAFNLMKTRDFDASTAAFNRLIVDYPNGQFTVNAFYWLGELYLASSDNEQARQSFMQVITLYPDHQKVADTLYKLGVVYHRLGDTNRAMEYLNRVQNEFPGSSAAGLASNYSRELQ
ncbi:MAG: tol-pal system protein YbgF [Proteobacteria bacterium]|nr:tol-pal system protein YbgF [Pseudomonadota bacterium]